MPTSAVQRDVALAFREGRRSSNFAPRSVAGVARKPASRIRVSGGNGALWSARGGAIENTNPQHEATVGRRSPSLGSNCENTSANNFDPSAKGRRNLGPGAISHSTNNRSNLTQTLSNGAALADITNVGACLGSQVKPVKPPHSLQLPAPPLMPEAVAVVQLSPVTEIAYAEGDDRSVQEYVPDIVKHLFREEPAFLPRPDYMDSQRDISNKMRTILIDWLVEVHMKYRLRPETLHLAVNLIDRYLSKTTVMRKRLQLVGVVAMFIASKYEEIRPPEVHDWVYITDNACTKDDVLQMECSMLTALSFQITVPTAAHFFNIFEKANGCDDMHRDLVQYILELSLLDISMLHHTPSHLVAAAVLLSNELLKRSILWPAPMVQQSRNTLHSLRGCVDDFRQLLEADRAGDGGQLQAVRKKFSTVQRHAVAKMTF